MDPLQPPLTPAPADPNVQAPAVLVRGLAKAFGKKVAVQPTQLAVPRGSFYGVVGPNGAGKTTLIRMATGLLRPDQGSVLVDGIDVWANPVAAKAGIGILPDERRMFERLSGRELLLYNGLLRGMDEKLVRERLEDLLAVLELSDDGDKLVIDYSAGMHKKIALAAALLHDPRVLFLDEPLESVDPVSARTIREVLTRLVDRGATVILSSHVMQTVQQLCSHVAIMAAGVIVAAGGMDQVRGGLDLEDRFIQLVGAPSAEIERRLGWLGTSSDSRSR
ncbi:ABC transporter ATP-binding protein [Propionibacteriaceae bacterium Y1923]|uniref:ABC transporter ATP-binding protein n=1 Tax=Aestuariimicrobium sp. Y1814 TaxID=3418742 RepID=UPI003C15D475